MSDPHGGPEQSTGAQPSFERGDTAPFRAVPSNPMSSNPASSNAGRANPVHPHEPVDASEERTRPTFPPPNAASDGSADRTQSYGQQQMRGTFTPPPPAAPPATSQQPAYQPPAPTQQAMPGPRQPGTDPRAGNPAAGRMPHQPGVAPGPHGTARNATGTSTLTWVLRGAVLLGVSIVSGLLWLVLNPSAPEDEAAPEPPPGPPPGKYHFDPLTREEGYQGCEDVANGQIREYFLDKQCAHLTRALYQTRLPNGDQVLTSVITVLMPDPASASELNELTTKDATGNVYDLVDSKSSRTENLPALNDAGYFSEQQGRLVVIGDSAFYNKQPDLSGSETDPELVAVTQDALRLGWPQDQAPR